MRLLTRPSHAAILALTLVSGPASGQFVDVAAGLDHSLGLRACGTVVAWGNNGWGQCNVPPLPPGMTYVEISAGGAHDSIFEVTYGLSLARRSDGSVVAWGDNSSGQLDVPPLPPGLTYVEIAAGNLHSLARLSDGSVVAWGANFDGQCNVPALPPGLTYVEISAGGDSEVEEDYTSTWPTFASWHRGFSMARRSDGSVVAWGDNTHGQLGVPPLPPGVTYVEISAGSDHVVARRSDGSVVAWGDDSYGQSSVPAPPPGLTYDAIDAGGGTTMARLSDGSVTAWGQAAGSVPGLPPGVTYVDVSVGGGSFRWTDIYHHQPSQSGAYAYSHTLALRSDGAVVAWGTDEYGQTDVPSEIWTDLGGGTAGVAGLPQLDLLGPLTPASTVTLDLVGGAPLAPAFVFVSFASTPTPFLGGTLHTFPFDELVLVATDVAGEIHGSTWFPGAASCQGLWFQVGIVDATVPVYGASLSNGVVGFVP